MIIFKNNKVMVKLLQLSFISLIILVLISGYSFGQNNSQKIWTDIGPGNGVTYGVYCDPTNANYIYLMVDTGHLFRSTDKGITWERISQSVATATMPNRQYRGGEHAVAVDPRPNHGNIVYFSPGQETGAGLWRSTDYGDTWTKTNGNDDVGAAVVGVDHNGFVYCISGHKKIYSSTDSGNTWTSYAYPFQIPNNAWYNAQSYRCDIEITTNNVIWATGRIQGDGIWYTTDKGQTWTQRLSGKWIVDITCSPVDSNLVLALGQDGNIYRSANGGASFTVPDSIDQGNYWSFNTWPPHRGGITINGAGIAIAIGRYSMGRSTDGGQTWTNTPEANLNYSASPEWPFSDKRTTDQALKCCDISSSPVDSNFFIYGDGAMVKESTDGGNSWVGGNNKGVNGLWANGSPYYDASNPNTFHVACVDEGEAYTTDLGKTWHSSEPTRRYSCEGVTQDPNNSNVYYKISATNNGTTLYLFKSTNGGQSYTQLTSVALASADLDGHILVDPTNSNIIYITERGGKGVYKSTNGGSSFSVVYTQGRIHYSMITKNGDVYFHLWNGGGGLYRYLKSTNTWSDIASGYNVWGFAVNPNDENIIFISNSDGYLYKTTNALSASPTWTKGDYYDGQQLYIDPYVPRYMLMMTGQKNVGMIESTDGGNTWQDFNNNLGTSFVWGFVPGGPAAKGRVYCYDQTAYYATLYDSTLVSINDEVSKSVPGSFFLGDAYPNPFNPSTNIKFNLPASGNVSLKVYNLTGQLVMTIINNQFMAKGEYHYSVSMNKFASGVYFYRLQQGANVVTKKMVLLK